MFVIKGLSKTYPGGFTALEEINLEILQPQVVMIIGSSGAGKSTLIRCINRLIEPTTDQLNRRGGVCWSHPAYAYRHVFARNDTHLVAAGLAAE